MSVCFLTAFVFISSTVSLLAVWMSECKQFIVERNPHFCDLKTQIYEDETFQICQVTHNDYSRNKINILMTFSD